MPIQADWDIERVLQWQVGKLKSGTDRESGNTVESERNVDRA